MVQIREKDLSTQDLYELAKRIKEVTEERARLLVNNRMDIALAVGADGVHLPENGLPTVVARRLAGPKFLVGRSVHTAESAVDAESDGADFLIAGTIFPSSSHPEGRTQGTEFVHVLREKISIPFLAIGGVTPENVSHLVDAGASGAAVITAISEGEDPRKTARSLIDEMARPNRK